MCQMMELNWRGKRGKGGREDESASPALSLSSKHFAENTNARSKPPGNPPDTVREKGRDERIAHGVQESGMGQKNALASSGSFEKRLESLRARDNGTAGPS